MSNKPNTRNWNDVQTMIATVSIVSTLGFWNLFAAPVKRETIPTAQPTLPPTEPLAPTPALMPQVKIMFTSVPTPAPVTVQQPQQKRKKNRDKGGDGGGSVATTKSS